MFVGSLTAGIAMLSGCAGEVDTSKFENTATWATSSPDGKIKTEVVMDYAGNLSYTVKRSNVTVIEKSTLGIDIAEDDLRLLSVENVKTENVKGSYNNISGKHSKVDYDCNQTTITLKGWTFEYDLIVRSYDDGYAFRYNVRKCDGTSGTMIWNEEKTEFALPEGSTLWAQPYAALNSKGNFFAYENEFQNLRTDELADVYISMPMLYKVKGTQVYSLITESDLIGSGFYGTFLKEHDDNEGTGILQTVPTPAGYMLDDNKINYPFESPWRVGIVGDLKTVQESELVEKVFDDVEPWRPDDYDTLSAEEKKIYDYDWVEPDVVAWNWVMYPYSQGDYGLHRRYINLAVEMGWKYVLVDGGWDDNLKISEFKQFVKEANDKGIKILVWCHSFNDFALGNVVALRQKLELWKSWGVSGIKIDFFDGQSTDSPKFYGEDTGTIDWYEKIYQECAKREMLVNCHGSNKPTGERRIYPNVINREGIKGNEFKGVSASDAVKELFIRRVVGPSDFTPVVNPLSTGMTMAHQMALAVLFESGTPSMADFEDVYENILIKEFYKSIPSLCDDTLFLGGEPDKYYVGAVRSGDEWLVAGANAIVPNTAKVSFSFLEEGVTYNAEIFTNHETDYKKVERRTAKITKDDIEFFDMIKNGGFVVRLTPVK